MKVRRSKERKPAKFAFMFLGRFRNGSTLPVPSRRSDAEGRSNSLPNVWKTEAANTQVLQMQRVWVSIRADS